MIAGTWAAMQYMGEEYVYSPPPFSRSFTKLNLVTRGYIASCREIVGTAKAIAHILRTDFADLSVMGSPPGPVVAFRAVDPAALNILEVGDRMAKRGWHLNALQNPPGLHIAVTVRTVVASLFCFQMLIVCG